MKLTTQFIILIERSATVRRFVMLLGLLMLAAGALTVRPAFAQTAQTKIAADLQAAISASTTPKLSWVKDVNGIRYVKALVVASSTDPDLTALRSDVLARGGSVYFRYVRGLPAIAAACARRQRPRRRRRRAAPTARQLRGLTAQGFENCGRFPDRA